MKNKSKLKKAQYLNEYLYAFFPLESIMNVLDGWLISLLWLLYFEISLLRILLVNETFEYQFTFLLVEL